MRICPDKVEIRLDLSLNAGFEILNHGYRRIKREKEDQEI